MHRTEILKRCVVLIDNDKLAEASRQLDSLAIAQFEGDDSTKSEAAELTEALALVQQALVKTRIQQDHLRNQLLHLRVQRKSSQAYSIAAA